MCGGLEGAGIRPVYRHSDGQQTVLKGAQGAAPLHEGIQHLPVAAEGEMIDRGRERGKALLCITARLVEEFSDPFFPVALEPALGLSARLLPPLHVSGVSFLDRPFAVPPTPCALRPQARHAGGVVGGPRAGMP